MAIFADILNEPARVRPTTRVDRHRNRKLVENTKINKEC